MKSEKLLGIQCLRGVAALLVVWFHLQFNLGVGVEEALAKLPAWTLPHFGAIGVDIFFVVSGVVISLSAEHLGRRGRVFLLNRFARIAPLYYAVSIYCLIFMAFSAIRHTGLPEHIPNTIFNSFAFLPMFDRNHFSPPAASVGWTLCFEVWFYLLFALLMMFLGGRMAGRSLPVLLLIAVIGVALFYRQPGWILPSFLFHPMTLEFGAGCLIYQGRDHFDKRVFWPLCLLLVPLAFLAYRTAYLGDAWKVIDNPRLGFERAVVWGGFATCLVAVVSYMDWRMKPRWPQPLLLLGEASFSIYLIHPCFRIFIPAYGLAFHHKPGSLACGLVYLANAIGMGLLVWKYLEVPLTRATKTFLSRWISDPNRLET
jgi:peptidoglycan/LPS O-acetylase OafA/YrhL